MKEYVITINKPGTDDLYFAEAGGYTSVISQAKIFTSYQEAMAKLFDLSIANKMASEWGEVVQV